MLAFFAGLQRTGPSTAAILSTFEPVVTTAFAALTLDEFLTSVQLLGWVLVLSSSALVQLRARPRPQDSLSARHRVSPLAAGDGPAGARPCDGGPGPDSCSVERPIDCETTPAHR